MKLAVFTALGASLISVGLTWSLARALLPPEGPGSDLVSIAEHRRLSERVGTLAENLRVTAERLQDLEVRLSTVELERELAQGEPSAPGPRAEAGSGLDSDASSGGRPGDDLADGAALDDVDDHGASQAPDVEEAVALLCDPQQSRASKEAMWKRLAEEGGLDEVVAIFEQRAREAPGDPGRQFELGTAYVRKLLSVGDLERSSWFLQADACFDRALAIDPQHWESRFSKAMSYAFAPAALGYRAKAVEQFEILVGQQEAGAPRPQYAQAYLMLGNLYSTQGNADRASEVWKRGLELYPDDTELARRVDSN